jgi:hypothetical protein
MKFSKFLLSIFLASTLFSCTFNSNDKKVSTNLFQMIQGSGSFGFGNLSLEKGVKVSKNYIYLEIDSSGILYKNGMSKSLLASYCATELYNNLDQSRIQENEGINISYADDPFDSYENRHYYRMSHLYAVNQINGILYDFTQSFTYGNNTSDYLASDIDSIENIRIKGNFQKLDSLNLTDLVPNYSFHSTFPKGDKNDDKLLLTWIYNRPDDKSFAFDFVTSKEIKDGIIYSLQIRTN